MPRLNYQQVAQLAIDAGWRGKDAETAVGIARAESGFDTTATNFGGRDYSFGLWQINMKDAMGPERRQKYGLSSNEQLFDARTNARVAYAIWKERGGFTDWSTFNDKKYLVYLNGAVFAVKQIQQGKTGTEIPSYDSGDVPPGETTTANNSIISNPLGGLTDSVSAIGNFLTNRENWLRAASVIGGGLLVVLAIALIMTDTVVGVALKKAGKVAKVVK